MWLVAIFAQISVYSADIRVWEMWWISEIKRQQQNKKRGLAILINEMILLKSRIMKSKPGKKVSFALAFFPLLVWICCDGLIILFPYFFKFKPPFEWGCVFFILLIRATSNSTYAGF